MKTGAILINTSRGDIVSEEAVLQALRSKKLRSYGTDVIMGADGGANKLGSAWGGDMRNNPLVSYAQQHDNVVITPHLGGGTYKSVIDARIFSARRLIHFVETGKVLEAVNEIPFNDWPPHIPAGIEEHPQASL